MRISLSIVIAVGLSLLTGCTRQSSTQAINAEQADQLNAIAANQSEDAGNEIAQNVAQTGDIGQAYRAGANARPRKYH